MASLIQSDKSISGNLVKSKVTARKKQYRDLDLSLKTHPIRKDIIPLKDDAAVKNAIKNLLVTNFYERPFQDDLGANLTGLLFEPANNITRILIKDAIKDVIRKYEPRVAIRNIIVEDHSDRNAYKIKVNFRIKENNTEDKVNIVLRRLR